MPKPKSIGGPMQIIAERINSSRKSIAEAIFEQDVAFIQTEARNQDAAGADFIDVNAGTFVGEEQQRLEWLIETVQAATNKPLCIDSPDPAVIQAVIPLVDKTPMINSITLETQRLEGILPVAVEHKAKLIALCQSEGAMAETADDKLKMAGQLVETAAKANFAIQDLYIDPLVYPVSTNNQSALATLEAIRRIMVEFPGIHTTCGLTNVSYGLPGRKLMNRTFLVAAVANGLDSAILDPTDKPLSGALKAALTITGQDEFCMNFIGAFREGLLD